MGYVYIDADRSLDFHGVHAIAIKYDNRYVPLLCSKEEYELVQEEGTAIFFIRYCSSKTVPWFGWVEELRYDEVLTANLP